MSKYTTSPEAQELGANLVKFADAAESKWREEMGFVPARCASCAFRKGTVPNGYLPTVADAMKCTMERVPFYCHHSENFHPGRSNETPTMLCAGWLLLSSNEPATKAPWPWTSDIAEYGFERALELDAEGAAS